MLETELKCIIDERTYIRLSELFKWDWIKEQVNSYYTDSKNELKRNGITFRIREKDSAKKIQIKTHKGPAGPLQICEEQEYDTDTIPESFGADEVKKLTGISADVFLLGSLTTLRHSLMFCDGVEICLDKNDYLDKTDYEIEIEYTKPIPKELTELLNSEGVEFTERSVGKCSRFMIRLAAIMKGEL